MSTISSIKSSVSHLTTGPDSLLYEEDGNNNYDGQDILGS